MAAKDTTDKAVKPKVENLNCGACNHPSSFHKDRKGKCRTMACRCAGFTSKAAQDS